MLKMTKTTKVWRFSSLLMLPMLLVAVGCVEPVERTEEVRGAQAEEPCQPEDCIPLSPLLEPCPEGFELSSWQECVDQDGECVWEFYDECIPVDDPDPEPEPEPEGNGGGGHGHENETPGHVRPPSSDAPGHIKHHD